VLQQCTACRLAAVAYASSIWFDLTHLTHCQVESLQSKLPVEESMYWFVKTWLFTTCGGDRSTRHVQELHASTTSFILDFGCILCHVIIVLCIVFVQCLVSTLQMQRHCIHVAFERGC